MPVNLEQQTTPGISEKSEKPTEVQAWQIQNALARSLGNKNTDDALKNKKEALAHFALPTKGSDHIDEEQEKAKNPYKITTREHQNIIDQLKNGELPTLLSESWRIVDPASEEACAFHREVQSFGECLFRPEPSKSHLPNYELTHHDFGAEPVRFLLADQEEPNAWFVNHSKPTIIVFTKGLFHEHKEWLEQWRKANPNIHDRRPDPGTTFVRSPHDFAVVLAHEMTHFKLRKMYGEIPNSKIEEGVAYFLPLLIMREKSEEMGLNPERCQDVLKGEGIFEIIVLNKRDRAGLFSRFDEYMDVHPTAENTYSIGANTLAYLRKARGDIPSHVIESPAYNSESALINIVESGHHVSYVEAQLAQQPHYKTGSFADRTKIIQSIIENMSEISEVRVSDLVKELRLLQNIVDIKADKKSVDNLADAILHMGLIHTQEAFNLYLALSTAAGESMQPLGRLRILDKAIQKFVFCVAEPNTKKQQVIRAARQLNRLIEKEPLAASVQGRSLLQQIHFSHFEFPNQDELYDEDEEEEYEDATSESYLDDEGWDDDRDNWDNGEDDDEHGASGDEEDNEEEEEEDEAIEEDEPPLSRKKIFPAWHPLRELAMEDEEIAKCAAYVGMGYEPFILRSIFSHQKLVLGFCNPQLSVSKMADMLPAISLGPRDYQAGSTLANLYFNEGGALIHHSDERGDLEKDMRREFEDHLSVWADHIFLESKGKVKPIERLRVLQRFVPQSSRLQNKPLCLDVCEHDIDLFLELNTKGLGQDSEQAKALICHFTELLSANAQQYVPLVRHLFLSDLGKEIIMNSIEGFFGMGFLVEKIDEERVDEKDFHKLVESGGVFHPNPYMNFLIRPGSNSFTVGEVKDLLDEFLVRSGSFTKAAAEFDEKLAQAYLRPLTKIADQAQCMYTMRPKKWDTLLSALSQEHATEPSFSLMKSLLYCEAILLLKRCKPTLDQAAAFAEIMGSEAIIGTNMQHTMRKILEKEVDDFPERVKKSSDLLHVVKQWKSLSGAGLMFPEQSNLALETLVERIIAIGVDSPASAKESVELCETLLAGERVQNPQLRKQVVITWAKGLLTLHGIDLDEPGFHDRILEIAERILAKVNRIDRTVMLNALCKRLETQHTLSLEIQRRLHRMSERDKENLPLFGGITDISLQTIRNDPEYRQRMILFLTSPLTEESCNNFLRGGDQLEFAQPGGKFKLSDRENVENKKSREDEEEDDDDEEEKSGKSKVDETQAFRRRIAKQATRDFYMNFWAAPLELRAILIREMLVSPDTSIARIDEKTFNFAIKRTFPADAKYGDDARHFIRAYVDALPHFQKHLCLAALMAASEKTGAGEQTRIGQALAFFLESMGPAETKVGQGAQSHPLVPPDIRADLRRLKFSADEPNRWEVTEWVEHIREDSEQQYNGRNSSSHIHIQHIGDTTGSGSLFVVVNVLMSDGAELVLSLLRPDALNRGHTGFSTLRRTAENLESAKSAATETVRELIQQANGRLDIEVNCRLAHLQYANARDIYHGAKVMLDEKEYRFSSPDVLASGDAYFLMTKIHGEHFIELPEQNENEKNEKKQYAMANLVFELNNKLRGTFDCDRHGGNVKILRGMQTIGHFDFKAMALNEWSEEGFRQFSTLLVSALNGEKTVLQFFNDLLAQEKLLREKLQVSGKQLDPYVMEVQKGLLTDGEYTHLLGRHELMRVVISALLNGMHPDLQKSLLEEISRRIPETFRIAFESSVRPAIEQSFQTGTLLPELQQLLPVQLTNDEIIRIRRPSATRNAP